MSRYQGRRTIEPVAPDKSHTPTSQCSFKYQDSRYLHNWCSQMKAYSKEVTSQYAIAVNGLQSVSYPRVTFQGGLSSKTYTHSQCNTSQIGETGGEFDRLLVRGPAQAYRLGQHKLPPERQRQHPAHVNIIAGQGGSGTPKLLLDLKSAKCAIHPYSTIP